MEAPDVLRATLRRQRFDLLARESVNLERARRLLTQLEETAERTAVARGVLEEARRSVRLAEQVRSLGVQDGHRAGAGLIELERASGLSREEVVAILERRTERAGHPGVPSIPSAGAAGEYRRGREWRRIRRRLVRGDRIRVRR